MTPNPSDTPGFSEPAGDEEDEFQLRFLSTDEAEEWFAFTDAADAGLATGAETISVPAAFLRRALDQIKAEPLIFEHMRAAQERLRAGEGN